MSPQLNINFSKVQDLSPIEPGLYDVKVTNIEVKKSQNDNDMINLQLEITTKGEYKGRTLRDRLVLAEGAMWRVYAALSSLLGPQPKEDVSLNTDDLMDATGQIHLTNKVWAVEDGGDGKSRPRVSAWISEDAEDILDDDDIVM